MMSLAGAIASKAGSRSRLTPLPRVRSFRSACMQPMALPVLHRGGLRAMAAGQGLAPRLTPHSPGAGLTAEQETVYNRVLEDRGKTAAKGGFPVTNADGSLVGPWNAMVASPTIGSLIERMGSFCRHQNSCPADLFEIGILVVGAEWKSQFEWYAHERLALKAGLSPEAIEKIKQRVSPNEMSGMTSIQLAVYAYAKELHDVKRVSDATHARALQAVGGERALVDLVFTMGFYHQISMMLNAFNVPLPPGESAPFEEPDMPRNHSPASSSKL
mmetsp:Transcript_21189/g.46728  ORF Transcript_21189/g.46728 Transcript_21189/m.46728 type:complete len:272 (+) Transcript_21189:93-908(+)